MRKNLARMFAVGLVTFGASVASLASGPSATEIAREINLATAAATAVVASLQDKINTAKLSPADVEIPALQRAMRENFKKAAGNDFEEAPDSERADVRKTIAGAFGTVIERFRDDMLRGGQDAFVPAFFRAQLLEIVNQNAKGKYQALVTNRARELINQDSSPEKLVKDKAVLAYVNEVLDKGDAEGRSQMFDGRLVSLFPMKIGEPCAACHKRNGLEQQVGQFGGATLIIVEARK